MHFPTVAIYLHIEVVDVVPENLNTLFLLVNFQRQPDVAALPERHAIPLYIISKHWTRLCQRDTYLVSHVKVGRLLRTLDPPGETRLSAECAGVGWGDEEGLGPWATERVGAECNDI